MSNINIIVAASNNGVIGRNNDIPWKLPTDLKHFKKTTEGSVVIMGRKSWDSLPLKFRPLPNRLNVVITRDTNFNENGCVVYNDLGYALHFFLKANNNDDVFVIGGGEIYKQSFKYANKLYLTRILCDIDGDVFLEGFNENEWNLVTSSETLEENGLKFVFQYYEKKQIN